MFDILLQVDTLTKSTEITGKVESVWSLLGKGGPLMIPLGILFALAVFFFIYYLPFLFFLFPTLFLQVNINCKKKWKNLNKKTLN